MDAIPIVRDWREACAKVKIAIVEIHGLVKRKVEGKMTRIKRMKFCNLFRLIEYTKRPK